jgi:hypothetical protein
MATFPDINPDYGLKIIPMFDTSIISLGGRKEQRIAHDSTVRYKFELSFSAIDPTDKNTIRDFFIARKGSFESFDWTTVYTVRFDMDLVNLDYFTYHLYHIEKVTLIEVVA